MRELALRHTTRTYHRGETIRAEGQRSESIYIVLDGWAEQHAQLRDGRSQVLAVYLPGQMCSADSFGEERLDGTLSALTRLRLGEIERDRFSAYISLYHDAAFELAASQRLQSAIQRRWLMCLGQRSALERIAHLMCELFVRQRVSGQAREWSCPFPLTQQQIAKICGLTQVHTNRVIQELRRRDLAVITRKQLRLIDFEALSATALFDPSYLQ
ncbi:hypothetical protein B2G71_21580 [Novosphingobium sp. PC22D]|nr:hypothetical protein B2G71_21580 [Novosphingobium sp. PC22D]